jgi:SAM-dependent methyltransferase
MVLARYFAHAHPGSRQVVIEPNKELTETVLRRFPLPGDARISLLHNDGRTALGTLDSRTADLIVMDAYAGGHVPEELTTAECVEQLSRVLRDDGVLVFGLIDYPETEYVARVCATVRSATPLSIIAMSPHHKYFGNHTLLCARPGVITGRILAQVKGADDGYVMRSADWLDARCAQADVLTDAAPAPSPDPPTESLGASW